MQGEQDAPRSEVAVGQQEIAGSQGADQLLRVHTLARPIGPHQPIDRLGGPDIPQHRQRRLRTQGSLDGATEMITQSPVGGQRDLGPVQSQQPHPTVPQCSLRPSGRAQRVHLGDHLTTAGGRQFPACLGEGLACRCFLRPPQHVTQVAFHLDQRPLVPLAPEHGHAHQTDQHLRRTKRSPPPPPVRWKQVKDTAEDAGGREGDAHEPGIFFRGHCQAQ